MAPLWWWVEVGTTSGEPVTGSTMTRLRRPKTCATNSSFDEVTRCAAADEPAVAQGDDVVGVPGREVEVVQDHDDGASPGCG